MKENEKKAPETSPETETVKESETEALLAEIEKLKKENAEKDDKYLRMAAEYDNFRRRSREEREAVYDSAVADTVSDLLEIIDNLGRAAGFDDGEKVKEGLAMTLTAAEAVLTKLGVESFGEAGDAFDPNLHNAVLHIEDESLGENTVAEVFKKGYKKGNKIIRFAMVKTAN